MKYEITKISEATNRAEGKTKSFVTAKELLSELSDRNNGWGEGRGSIIEKNGVEIFHTRDYLKLENKIHDDYDQQRIDGVPYKHREPKADISIKKIINYKNEREEREY